MVKRAWIMVSSKTASLKAGDQIRDELHLKGIEVFGPYDVIVEVEANTPEELYENHIKKIVSLPDVGASTTYWVVKELTKPKKEARPIAYILVHTAPLLTEHIQEEFFKLEEVQKADVVLGPYDIVVEIATDSRIYQQSALDFLHWIQNLVGRVFGEPGIIKTLTMITFPER